MPRREMIILSVKLNMNLYQAFAKEAEKRGKRLNELAVEVLAKHVNRPDLDFIPRKKMGRPRKTA